MKPTGNQASRTAWALGIAQASRFTKLLDYRPYPKQREFHALGKTKRERACLSANQVGKTYCGAAEMAMHLTGFYPEWWVGLRFDHPINAWAGAITNEDARDVVQKALFGREGEWGTGMIPEDRIESHTWARGIANLVDTAQIRHITGGHSILSFKCHPRGERVLCADGIWVPIEDVEVGTLVRRSDGSVAPIEQRHIYLSAPLMTIETRAGLLRLTPNHPVYLEDGRRVLAEDIAIGDRLEMADCSYEKEEMREDWWFAIYAVLIGDGCLRANAPFFTSTDPGFVSEIAALLPKNLHIRSHSGARNHFISCSEHRNFLSAELRSDGLWRKKAHEKFIPEWVFQGSRRQRVLFLHYLWSCDGTVNRHSASYTSTSLHLIRDVQALLASIGIRARVRSRPGTVRPDGNGERYRHVHRVDLYGENRLAFMEIGKHGRDSFTDLVPRGHAPNQVVSIYNEGAPETVFGVGVAAPHEVVVEGFRVGNSYAQGRKRWQGADIHFVWFDEEPEGEEGAKIYSEGITRTTATGGSAMMTFTPLLGMTQVVSKFFPEPDAPHRGLVQMTIEDAEHIPAERRAAEIAKYPEHEREARARGIPMLGSGRVFPIAESEIVLREDPERPFAIEKWWPRIAGMDFGWDHPNAVAWLAYDRDADTIYVYAEHRQAEQVVAMHADAIRSRGTWIPCAWPHDGLVHDKGSGIQLAQQYAQKGVRMIPEHAQFPNGSNGLEAGIQEMLDRMKSGRWKVLPSCRLWLEEFRMYHRKDGKIVKMRDDLISASRYALMDLRYARTEEPRGYSRPLAEYDPLEALQ